MLLWQTYFSIFRFFGEEYPALNAGWRLDGDGRRAGEGGRGGGKGELQFNKLRPDHLPVGYNIEQIFFEW